MQRSRRALLQRRAAASEKKGNSGGGAGRLSYTLSLSLAMFLWGLVFLLSFLIGHGNDYRDNLNADAGEQSRNGSQPDPIKSFDSGECLAASVIITDHIIQDPPISKEKVDVHSQEMFVSSNGKGHLSTTVKEQAMETLDPVTAPESGTLLKNDRLSRVAPPGLDVFKSRAFAAKEQPLSSKAGAVIHRLEPDGKEYNYASAKKGAKILASNKEAKGDSNILDKDMDKYLRNPCSAEDKYVVIELSEETLVDTIEIGNFEHYSSNLKDFELYISLVYPTDSWSKLGNFTAQNVKQAQKFTLPDPEWARYLKLNMLSHYGSEFYCTLSVVKVYGVDVVERMLEDLISLEAKRLEPADQNNEQIPQPEPTKEDAIYQNFFTEVGNEFPNESLNPKKDVPKGTVANPVLENRPLQVGRMPGDTVLKILLQKVQSLELNFSVLEKYLEELNIRYGHIFKDFDDDMSNTEILLEKIRLEIKDIQNSKDIFNKDIEELHSWKSLVSLQLEQLAKDNILLRSEFKRSRDHQADLENRGLVVIFMSLVFGCLATAKLFVGMILGVFESRNSAKICRPSSAWGFLLLSSGIIALILAV